MFSNNEKSNGPLSLDEIITAQIDEPHQKSCIYRTKLQAKKDKLELELEVTKFTQIRVKTIKFLEKDAIAIYFYDMTHHVESLN